MNIFVWNCLKSQRKKKFFFAHFFTFEVPFNGLFAPTSQSRMSNIFRDSESLGKSNGKKWSHIWTFFLGSGLKSPRAKKVFFVVADFALVHLPMASVLLSASVERCFVSRMRDFKNTDQNAPKKIILNCNYIALHLKSAFKTDFGPREVPELENLHFHFHVFSGWGTSKSPKSVLKEVF